MYLKIKDEKWDDDILIPDVHLREIHMTKSDKLLEKQI